MKPELEQRCTDYIANRDAVGKAFRWDNSVLYNVCANIFCACGQAADPERLKECRAVIKAQTRPFSRFRSAKVRSILASLLALAEKPEERMAQANDSFRLLKREFRKTEYLVLAAFLLTDLGDWTLTEETAARGREIYRRMNREHRMLTNKTDSVFAALLAFSGKTDDELAAEIETIYRALKGKFTAGGAQAAAQVLCMTAGAPEEKTRRLIALFDALHEAGIAYGRSDEAAPLAALSLADAPVSVLAEEIRDADAFLKTQKGYGAKETNEATRAVHAVMIVSDQYTGTRPVNITVMTNTLDLLFSKQKASRVSLAVNALEALLKVFAASREKAGDGASGDKAGETEGSDGGQAGDGASGDPAGEAGSGDSGTGR